MLRARKNNESRARVPPLSVYLRLIREYFELLTYLRSDVDIFDIHTAQKNVSISLLSDDFKSVGL